MSAAFRMAWPANPALPLADSGRMRPTLTSPVPIVAGVPGALAAVGGVLEKNFELEKTLELPEHPVSHVAVAPNRASERRRDNFAAVARTCNSAAIAVPLTSASALA
jgi:hypothetical protein